MALQKQLIYLPFSGGPDTKTDPKQVSPGKLLRLFNGVFKKPKEISKRPGTSAQPRDTTAGGVISAGQAIFPYRDELLMVDTNTMYSFSQSLEQWQAKGTIPGIHVTRTPIVNRMPSQAAPGCAY